jgi:hypothetical protein
MARNDAFSAEASVDGAHRATDNRQAERFEGALRQDGPPRCPTVKPPGGAESRYSERFGVGYLLCEG